MCVMTIKPDLSLRPPANIGLYGELPHAPHAIPVEKGQVALESPTKMFGQKKSAWLV
jgi:hypothetical protein